MSPRIYATKQEDQSFPYFSPDVAALWLAPWSVKRLRYSRIHHNAFETAFLLSNNPLLSSFAAFSLILTTVIIQIERLLNTRSVPLHPPACDCGSSFKASTHPQSTPNSPIRTAVDQRRYLPKLPTPLEQYPLNSKST
jgi:hypothetical protein